MSAPLPAYKPSMPRRSGADVTLVSGLMVAISALFFIGGYLFGHADGRTGQGPLPALGWLPGSEARAVSDSQKSAFGPMYEALAEIQRNYYKRDQLDEQKLAQGAVKGLVEAVGDPNTLFLSPQSRQASESELRGSFGGIGVEMDLRDGKLRVVTPLDGSPGQRAGIQPNDVIVKVDGQDVTSLSLSDAVARIRGPKGTAVELTVQREGATEPLVISVVRDEIKIESVRSRLLEDGSYAYLRITNFAEPTGQQLHAQLRSLLESRPRGLVLDLRSNPGGFVNSAVDVTGTFVKDGSTVLFQQRGPSEADRKAYRTSGTPQVPDLPLVVLVDRGSASAAEIVAGALRDHQRATIVGEKTFGKGTVQELHNLSDSSQIRVTVAQWLLPSGQPINGQGLAPDVVVQPVEGQDAMLDAAVQVLAQQVANRG